MFIEQIVWTPIESVAKTEPVVAESIVAEIEIRVNVLAGEKDSNSIWVVKKASPKNREYDVVRVDLIFFDVKTRLDDFLNPYRVKWARKISEM